MPTRGNLFQQLPAAAVDEHVTTLLRRSDVRIEHIVSHGQASPEGFWYEQAEDEWVFLLRGDALLGFADGRRVSLAEGDWLLIPAGCRHRVEATSRPAVWLAIFLATAAPGALSERSGAPIMENPGRRSPRS